MHPVSIQTLRSSAYPLVNLLLFKLSWLLLVVGQQAGVPWALALQGVSLALHPALRAACPPALGVAAAGIGIDALCQWTGLFVFPQERFPAWLVVLWLSFAFALPQGLGFLRRFRLPVLALAGAVLGPLSYGIGERLDAVAFGLPQLPALAVLAAIWALFLPLALRAEAWRLKPLAAVVVLSLPGLLPAADARAEDAAAARQQRLLGTASLSWFFRPIYDAELYVDNPEFSFPSPQDFTFLLEYRLNLKQEQIVKETLRQWQRQGVAVEQHWVDRLHALIPDVRAGDRLILQVEDGSRARLLHNDEAVGSVDDVAFINAFAGIWLAENTTRPDLRNQLLGLP
ncbi:MAG: DUF2878 family protein [Pseudohongiellaceae bacterium]